MLVFAAGSPLESPHVSLDLVEVCILALARDGQQLSHYLKDGPHARLRWQTDDVLSACLELCSNRQPACSAAPPLVAGCWGPSCPPGDQRRRPPHPWPPWLHQWRCTLPVVSDGRADDQLDVALRCLDSTDGAQRALSGCLSCARKRASVLCACSGTLHQTQRAWQLAGIVDVCWSSSATQHGSATPALSCIRPGQTGRLRSGKPSPPAAGIHISATKPGGLHQATPHMPGSWPGTADTSDPLWL